MRGQEFEVENDAEDVIAEAFWLAYQSAGGARGMGALQENPNATKEDVWENVRNEGDYPGDPNASDGEYHGDYVFGKMLKLRLWNASESSWFGESKNAVAVPNTEINRRYQAWASDYDTYEELIREADSNLS